MTQKVSTFLMFSGKAEEAMNLYVSLFAGAEVVSIERYGAGEVGNEGTVQHAVFTLGGTEFHCIDSSVDHAFEFTPAVSLFITCESVEEVDRLFEELSDGGTRRRSAPLIRCSWPLTTCGIIAA